MLLKNALKHTKLVLRHKWVVFKLCCRVGIPWRGFMHDWSKFSPTEFCESIRYYVGTHSPIEECRRNKGYSYAWVHHVSKNKHHYHLIIRDTKRHKNCSTSRLYSFFNLGLTIFNLCYDSSLNFVLKFNFVLYDV